jgi:hypothetical protein
LLTIAGYSDFLPYLSNRLFSEIITSIEVVEKPHVFGLFKNVRCKARKKSEPRGVYGYTLSGAACSATQQMSVFQQPSIDKLF